MKPEQLFKQTRKSGEIGLIEINLGPSYLSLVKSFILEEYVYPNEIVEKIKQEIDFLYEYKSYHLGYFIERGRFFSFSGLSSLNHVLFSSKDLKDHFNVAMIGYSYNPEMSLFIDVDESSNSYESVFVQDVSTLGDIQNRIYIANNVYELISKLRLYLVGELEKITII
jgi:hypothetical protein